MSDQPHAWAVMMDITPDPTMNRAPYTELLGFAPSRQAAEAMIAVNKRHGIWKRSYRLFCTEWMALGVVDEVEARPL
jgi:hypothetical protein